MESCGEGQMIERQLISNVVSERGSVAERKWDPWVEGGEEVTGGSAGEGPLGRGAR